MRLLSTVGIQVALKSSFVSKGFAADFTSVGFLTRVDPLVPNETWLLREGSAADVTNARLFSRVDPAVSFKIVLSRKAGIANVTHEWFLASVRPRVLLLTTSGSKA